MGAPSWADADTKYDSEECLRYLQDRGIKTSINPEIKSNRPGHYSKEEFVYDKEKGCYICTEGNILERKAKNYKLNLIKYKLKKKKIAFHYNFYEIKIIMIHTYQKDMELPYRDSTVYN